MTRSVGWRVPVEVQEGGDPWVEVLADRDGTHQSCDTVASHTAVAAQSGLEHRELTQAYTEALQRSVGQT